MKKTFELIKEVERLKVIVIDPSEAMTKTSDFDYLSSQFKILDYVLMDPTLPEHMEAHLKEMYEVALQQCVEFGDFISLSVDDKKKLAAADILAWILDISNKSHKKNRKKGTIVTIK